MDRTENLGSRLRKLRKERGLTQSELGNLADVEYVLISRYEQNKVMPKIETLNKLCSALNVSVDEILNGKSNQEFEVKIVIGVKNLTDVAGIEGIEIGDNKFFYGVDDTQPQITLAGKINIATEELRKKALNEIIAKFHKACWMFDHQEEADAAIASQAILGNA